MTQSTLSHTEARAFYDRFGSRQDWQRFYEDAALADLIAHADFKEARSVFEFGCGTGRFAETLLEKHLPKCAKYLGIDISTTMVRLAQQRLARFGPRAEVRLTEGEFRLDCGSNSFDRFVSTYVLDLLSVEEIRILLLEAHRVLGPGGLGGFVGLTYGVSFVSRLIEKAWVTVHSIRPSLLGGCRPISVVDFLQCRDWKIRHSNRIARFGLSSQVVVAEKAAQEVGADERAP